MSSFRPHVGERLPVVQRIEPHTHTAVVSRQAGILSALLRRSAPAGFVQVRSSRAHHSCSCTLGRWSRTGQGRSLSEAFHRVHRCQSIIQPQHAAAPEDHSQLSACLSAFTPTHPRSLPTSRSPRPRRSRHDRWGQLSNCSLGLRFRTRRCWR